MCAEPSGFQGRSVRFSFRVGELSEDRLSVVSWLLKPRGTDPSQDLTALRWNMNTVCNVSTAALMLDDSICYGSTQFSTIHVV